MFPPTGPYAVGTTKIDLYDVYRPEEAYPMGRLIPCQWYFPLDTKNNQACYEKEIETRGSQKFPPLKSNYFSKSSSLEEIRRGPHPLIILNPGHCVDMTDYTFITEDLASHGYIVVSIGHELASDPPLPELIRNRSCTAHAQIIDNILYVFHWISQNIDIIFQGKLDLCKVAHIGHSRGANALLMLASRISSFFRGMEEYLLPYPNTKQPIKECIIFMDGEFPPISSSTIPIFYMISEERKAYQKDRGTLDYLTQNNIPFKHYTGSKHISFMDHAMVYKDISETRKLYFSQSPKELFSFCNDVRNDIREFLYKAGIAA